MGDPHIGKISSVGNSLLVYIPKKFCEELNLRKGQYVRIVVENNKIVVEPLDLEAEEA